MSNNLDNDYFCDGISEEIINALTKIKGLKVTARTSSFAFKNKNLDVRHIGNQLNVASVIEGSIRIFNNRIRINVQLVRTSDGFHTWSKNFDRNLEDIFELQDEISLIIAERIRENFGHLDISESISIIGTKSLQAYKLYLKGRSYQLNWILEDYNKAIDYYKKSIIIDPEFYDAYFSLSRSYGILSSWGVIDKIEGEKQANFFLEKGLKINPTSYLGFFSKSSIVFWNDWDYANGIKYLKKTLNENPSFAIAYEGIAEIYMATNQLDKALININRALEISPLSPNHYFTKGNIFFLLKDYKTAITFLEECLKIDPNFVLAIETKLACYMLLNDYERFNNYLGSMPQLISPNICQALFALINKNGSQHHDFDKTSFDVEKSFKEIYPWYFYYLIHSDELEKAIKIFDDKIKVNSGQLVNFRLDPFLEPLKSHKTYQSLQKNIAVNVDSVTSDKLSSINTKESLSKRLKDKEVDHYIRLIEATIPTKKLYLNPNFSLRNLGEAINLHPNTLSWLLNEHLNNNFNEFINKYRLEHFKQEVLKPSNSSFTLLGIAYDSGFNSKTVFNTFFKKETGLTPRQWVKSNS